MRRQVSCCKAAARRQAAAVVLRRNLGSNEKLIGRPHCKFKRCVFIACDVFMLRSSALACTFRPLFLLRQKVTERRGVLGDPFSPAMITLCASPGG